MLNQLKTGQTAENSSAEPVSASDEFRILYLLKISGTSLVGVLNDEDDINIPLLGYISII